ncbi:uncharacterized protein LOC130810746 [Amaranthus tricolor]|uniref:uncharacterized protein LOC130810746 n=1 Tax=Amaranthus tricolor TaxID=29722 RepID=UPI0025849829|nr:uncharacterized protein LOC130810746 [Amaranthus tricolor]
MQKLLSALNKKGTPMLGTINALATEFQVCRKTITRLWNEVKKQITNNNTVFNLNSKRVGREAANKIKFDKEKFKAIKYEHKCTQHSVAKQMEVSQTTVCRWKKNKVIRKHTNAIKPTLSENNKLHRLSFALSKCEYDEQNDAFKFKPYTDVVHIDEKHFYLTRETQTYYLATVEVEPHRECQSKRFIPKIMFMCAVAKPIFTTNGDVFFDGKIGIWLFITQEPGKRTSKNRKSGELETKPIQSITKEHIRAMLITNVLPTIRAKWPQGLSRHIYIQQDNAKPHIAHNDREILEEAMKDGFYIQLVQQPPNSPDINNLSPQCLRFVFITLQACMIEVMKRQGGFDYHIPHMNKTKEAREETLPDYLWGIDQGTMQVNGNVDIGM